MSAVGEWSPRRTMRQTGQSGQCSVDGRTCGPSESSTAALAGQDRGVATPAWSKVRRELRRNAFPESDFTTNRRERERLSSGILDSVDVINARRPGHDWTSVAGLSVHVYVLGDGWRELVLGGHRRHETKLGLMAYSAGCGLNFKRITHNQHGSRLILTLCISRAHYTDKTGRVKGQKVKRVGL